jgi:hypothetical protein
LQYAEHGHHFKTNRGFCPSCRMNPGSARVTRAGEGLWPSRTFLRTRHVLRKKFMEEKFVAA